MKYYTKVVNFVNIIMAVLAFVATKLDNIFFYVDYQTKFFECMCVMIIVNLICSILSFKKFKSLSIFEIVQTILWFALTIIGLRTTFANAQNILIIQILSAAIVIIAIVAIVVGFVVKDKKIEPKVNSKILDDIQYSDGLESLKIENQPEIKTDYKKAFGMLLKIIIPCVLLAVAVLAGSYMVQANKRYAKAIEETKDDLAKISSTSQIAAYVYKSAEGKYVFTNEIGAKIAELKADKLSTIDTIDDQNEINAVEIDGVKLLVATVGNKIKLIASHGNEVLTIDKYDGYGVFDSVVLFIEQAMHNNDIENMSVKYLEDVMTGKTANRATGYYRVDTQIPGAEPNSNSTYLYFANEELNDSVLQIEITNEYSDEVPFLENYLKYKEKKDELSDDARNAIEDFYKYKKEYYLVNFDQQMRTQLNCKDVFYDYVEEDGGSVNNQNFTVENNNNANINESDSNISTIESNNDSDEESSIASEENKTAYEIIYAYKDGSIPYRSNEINGFVRKDGKDYPLESNYITLCADGKYIVVARADSLMANIYNYETFEMMSTLGDKIADMESFYYMYPIMNEEDAISYDENTGNQIVSGRTSKLATKDFEIIATSLQSNVKFVGTSMIQLYNEDKKQYEIYYYDENKIELLMSRNDDISMAAMNMDIVDAKGYEPYYMIGFFE